MPKRNKFFTLLILMVFVFVLINAPAYGITGAYCEVKPDIVGIYGNFTIRFVTESAVPGGGWIKISFPNGFGLPCNCGGVAWVPSDFLINGISPVNTPDGNDGTNLKYVKITIPSSMNIAKGSTVEVKIKETAKIRNPYEPGFYYLRVSTSSETTEYSTNTFEISYSYVQNVTFSVSNNTVASKSGITIGFRTGILGYLEGTKDSGDYVDLRFDSNFNLPNTIGIENIKVNGYTPIRVTVNAKVLRIDIPNGLKIPASGSVLIQIDEKARIENPSKPGMYGISVSTSKEQKEVSSNLIEIKDKPFVQTDLLITPDKPDGDNGYYKTQPFIVLIPRTNTGEVARSFYCFDSDPLKEYNSPIFVPEGVHVFNYYSTCSSAIEESKSVKFKVDFSSPQINIIQPKSDTVTFDNNCLIKGAIYDNSEIILTINTNIVKLDENGNFVYNFFLSEGENIIQIKAVDAAGNYAEENIKITLDSTTPTLTIASPLNWQVFKEKVVEIIGIVSPAKDVIVEVNGNKVSISNEGAFNYLLDLSNEGMNPIKIVAKHLISQKEVSKSIIVVYKPETKNASTVIVLKVGSKEATIGDKSLLLDVEPYIDSTSGRTLVPIRFIAEAFGAVVDWEPINKSITIRLGSKQIILQVGNTKALIDGDFTDLDQAPIIKGGRTMVPIRFISESLGAKVEWDPSTKSITITYPAD